MLDLVTEICGRRARRRRWTVALVTTFVVVTASCSSDDSAGSSVTTGAGTAGANGIGATTATGSAGGSKSIGTTTAATTTGTTDGTITAGGATTAGGQGGSTGATSTAAAGGTGGRNAGGTGGAQGVGGSGDAGLVPNDAVAPTGDASVGKVFVYASGYGGSIVTFDFDPQSGALSPRGSPVQVDSPSYLTWTNPARRLYALSEVPAGRVYAFAIDSSTGALTPIDDVASGGAGPALVYADASGKWLFSANYDGNTATVLPIQTSGGLGDAVDTESYAAGSFPHAAAVDPTRQFAYVLLKGAGTIAQYRFDGMTGKLTALTPARVAGTGPSPRHIAMHPSLKVAYVIDEEGSSMTAFNVNTDGTLTPSQTLSTRTGAGGSNATAEVQIHPSGQWLYGSNRGDDTIVQYALSSADGKMTFVGTTPSGGSRPQCFMVDPTGQFMVVANQGSDNLVVFRLDAAGKMQRMGNPIAVSGLQPTFVGAAIMP